MTRALTHYLVFKLKYGNSLANLERATVHLLQQYYSVVSARYPCKGNIQTERVRIQIIMKKYNKAQ